MPDAVATTSFGKYRSTAWMTPSCLNRQAQAEEWSSRNGPVPRAKPYMWTGPGRIGRIALADQHDVVDLQANELLDLTCRAAWASETTAGGFACVGGVMGLRA